MQTSPSIRTWLTPATLRAGGIAAVLALAVSGGAYAAVAASDDVDSVGTGSVSGASEGARSNAAVTVAAPTNTVSVVAEESTQAFETVRRETAALPAGVERVETEGQDGVTRTTYRVTSQDGAEVSREVVSVVAVQPRTDKVVLVGTGSASQSTGTAVAVADDGSLDDDFARLAQCESGGNPRAVNPAGYYGLYQFSLSTWRSVGGTGNPIDASPEEQLMRAKMLQARSGWGQWGCGH